MYIYIHGLISEAILVLIVPNCSPKGRKKYSRKAISYLSVPRTVDALPQAGEGFIVRFHWADCSQNPYIYLTMSTVNTMFLEIALDDIVKLPSSTV